MVDWNWPIGNVLIVTQKKKRSKIIDTVDKFCSTRGWAQTTIQTEFEIILNVGSIPTHLWFKTEK